MGLLVTILFFIVYAVAISLVIIYISSLVGAALMFFIPLVGIIIMPDKMAEFFSFELLSPMDGAVSICNIHVLLAVWAAFLSVIVYTEFLSWYLRYTGEEDEEGE